MATFATIYSEAFPNTPILSSAWNQNNEANRERFQKHDHTGVDENGPRIGMSGLSSEVVTRFENLETQITGLLSTINTLTDRIQVLEAAINRPRITGFNYTSPVHRGDSMEIEGENFNPDPALNIVKFFNGTDIASEAAVTAATQTLLTVTVPADAVAGRVTVEVGGIVSDPSPTPVPIIIT